MAPAKQCPLCTRNLTKTRTAVQCAGECRQWHHLECTGLSEVEFGVMKKMNNKWVCTRCKAKVETQIRSEQEVNNRRSLGSQGSQSYDDLVRSIKDLKMEIRDLVKDIRFYAEKYEEQRELNEEFKREIVELKIDNKKLNEEINRMKGLATRHVRAERSANIAVVGIKYEAEKGNVYQEVVPKVEQALKHVCPNLKRSDIVIRLSNLKKDNCPVIVEFKNKDDKKMFLEERKLKGRIMSSDCGLPGPNSGIYFNEDLSMEERTILRKAKILREKGYKYIWAKNGIIMARRADNGPIVRIRSESDVDRLIEQ